MFSAGSRRSVFWSISSIFILTRESDWFLKRAREGVAGHTSMPLIGTGISFRAFRIVATSKFADLFSALALQ